jgi:phage replication O-like protein O
MATANQVTFQGFQFPTTTPVPDEVLDVLMPQLSGAELKVLLYICRRTFGFKKDSDTISLHQIAHGITTRDGRVLDGGTGLSKRHVINALKCLEKRNIITVTRKVDETGLNGVNTYSLNMLDTGRVVRTKSPQGVVNPSSPGGSEKNSPRVVNSSSPTTNRKQETVIQETDVVVAIAQDLETFGIAKSAATRLIQDYPAAYIREKLEMAKALVSAGSFQVSQNPAGWLRKAIEEDYAPPRTYHRSRHKAREAKDRKTVQAEARDRGVVEQAQNVATESEQNVSTEMGECPQNAATQYRENNTEKKETEKRSKENETTWNKTVAKLTEALPPGETERRLNGTTLLQVTDTTARIAVPSASALAWLERRLYREIRSAMKGVLGKDLDLQFVTAT